MPTPRLTERVRGQLRNLGGGFPRKEDFDLGAFLSQIAYQTDFFDSSATVDIYVDPSASGGDGTSTSPFTTVQQALDSIPQGFASLVDIHLAEGTYTETSIAVTANSSYVSGQERIRILGAYEAVATITPTTGTLTPVVSAGGVTKHAQYTFSCNAWGRAIVDGEYFLQKPSGDSFTTLPVLAAFSDEGAGTIEVVNNSASLGVTPLTLYRPLSVFTSTVRLVGNASAIATLFFCRFEGNVQSNGVRFNGCYLSTGTLSGNPFAGSSDTLLAGCYVNGPGKLIMRQCYNCQVNRVYSKANASFWSGSVLTISGCVFAGASDYKLNIGAQQSGGSYNGNVTVDQILNCDVEGTSYGIGVFGAQLRMRQGNVSFEGGSNPVRVRYGGLLIVDSALPGLLTGEGTGPVLLESCGQWIGASAAHTYVNTSAPTEQVKVGANAAITFATVTPGKNDYAAGDSSEGCRAS